MPDVIKARCAGEGGCVSNPEPRVGFIGLGVMGLPMASHLPPAGYALSAYDSDPRALERLQAQAPAAVIIVNTVITPTASGAAGKSFLVMLGVQRDPTQIIRLGGYQDTYVKTAKGWRFKTRWLVWAPERSAADISRTAAAPK
jgi:hypothetical protein